MFKHVISQSILQFIVILVLVFAGDQFLPECIDSNYPKYRVQMFNPNKPCFILLN